jgi:hypothetical protein
VADFRERPLDDGPNTFLAANALTIKSAKFPVPGERLVATRHTLFATSFDDRQRQLLTDVQRPESRI